MDNALATRGTTALARPDYIKANDSRGTENIETADIKFPALRLAQAMSPEVKRADPAYLEGLREGELFNSITREIYGEEPVHLIIVNQLGHRNTQFDPKDRNVVLESNIPDDDPRCQFTVTVKDGQQVRNKPLATKFYDYMVLVIREGREPELMTLSLKSTQLKKAVALNSILKLSKLASFAHLFKATPVPEKKGNNQWYGWRFDSAGWVSEEQYALGAKYFDKFENKAKEVAANIAAEPEAPAAADGDDDIPF